MRRLWLLLCLLLAWSAPAWANGKLQGWTESGGVSVVIPGTQGSGSQRFQQSFRNATVTVYAAGTTNLSTIYSDNLATPTPQANPFTASATGYWSAYAAQGRYDVKFSGAGISTPFTLGDFILFDPDAVTVINNREYCITGANFGAKFTAAVALLPSTGGIVDCSNLQGAQSIVSDVFAGVTKPIRLLWPSGTAASSVNLSIPATTEIDFGAAGILSQAAATTASISGSINGALNQHFAGSGGFAISGNSAIYPQWFPGADAGAQMNAAIAALPSTGGIIDASAWKGTQTISTTVVVSKPIKILFGAATFTCPSTVPCFRTWSGSTGYDSITFEGTGQGITTFKTPAGAAPSVSAFLNIFELHDPLDTTGTIFSDYIRIANMTLDGNKSNVTIPPLMGTCYDCVHSGIFSQGTRYSVFENLEVKNFWFAGLEFGLYFQYNRLSNIYTSTNGYSNAIGYAGIQIGGTSISNVVVNHVSDGDINGMQLYDNAQYNIWSGTYRNNYHGVNMGDAMGNISQGNVVTASITTSGSQAFTVGGLGTTRNSTFTINVDQTAADAGVYIGPNVTTSNFNLVVRRANQDGVELHGSSNHLNVVAMENSQGSALAKYGVSVVTGATSNDIVASLIDNQGTQTQRGLQLQAGTSLNIARLVRTGASSNISDSGTNNFVQAENIFINQWTSSVATGTAPFTVTSTTPATNLHANAAGYNASGTQIVGFKFAGGSATIGGGGTVTVTLTGSSVFSGTGNYQVFGTNKSNANAFKIVNVSASQFTITGTVGDDIAWLAVGN